MKNLLTEFKNKPKSHHKPPFLLASGFEVDSFVVLAVEFFFFRFFALLLNSSFESDDISSNEICSSTFSTSESELSVSVGHFAAFMIADKRFFDMPISSSKQISCNSSWDLL